jgi:hypothetical protein
MLDKGQHNEHIHALDALLDKTKSQGRDTFEKMPSKP